MSEKSRPTADQRRSERERRRRDRAAEDGGGSDGQSSFGDLASDLLNRAASPTVLGAAVGAAAAARLAKGPTRPARHPQPDDSDDDRQADLDEAPEVAEADAPRAEPRDQEPRQDPEPQHEPEQPLGNDDRTALVRTARDYAEALTGRRSDSVSAIGRTAEGWRVVVEVVEVPRVPSTTDVLASYELRFDDGRDLLEYRRLRRYYRNVATGDLDL